MNKGEFRRFGIYSVSRTVDDNRSIFEDKHHAMLVRFGAKNTVSLGSSTITLLKKTYFTSANGDNEHDDDDQPNQAHAPHHAYHVVHHRGGCVGGTDRRSARPRDWYHSHDDSLIQIGRGLAGALIVEEAQPA